jgi:hypothetical protein
MKCILSRKAAVLSTALLFLFLLAPTALAGNGKFGKAAPAFSNKVKCDASGQSYAWRDGEC